MRRSISLLSFLLICCYAFAQQGYQKPPKEILDVLNALVTPSVSLSPARDRMLLMEGERYPSIADLSEPMLRLAGLRISPNTNGPHSAPRIKAIMIRTLADGREIRLALPAGARAGNITWSPDGRMFALTNTTANGIDLWLCDAATGKLTQVKGVQINAVTFGAMDWMPDGKTLLCKTVVPSRGAAPVASRVPPGPTIQESFGKESAVRTYQDLLKNAHDEALFDYYATSQLTLINAVNGKATMLGKPAIYATIDGAPDGQHILVSRIQKPYSYLHPVSDFPEEIEILDRTGKLIHKVASQPLQDQVPIDGVQTGPRGFRWHPTQSATLIWTEALDDGDPRKTAAHRDKVLMLKAPFTAAPVEIARTEHRFSGLTFGEKPGVALLSEFDRKRRWTRTHLMNFENPAQPTRVIFDRSVQDRYNDPGSPVMKMLANGRNVMMMNGDDIFLNGTGASPKGDRPFLNRFNLSTGKAEQIFRCDDNSYESVIVLLSNDGSKFITRYETKTEPPNYFLRSGEGRQALTNFQDPAPQLRKITRQLVKYKREDGVECSFTLYLPPAYKPGTPLPTVVWAYPMEFNDAGIAGQVSGSDNRFTLISGMSHLFFALHGYAVLDGATMPVVGKDPESVNNTYLEQVVMSAKAAIDKAVEMGVTDRNRVGVGGHSYGAFMTANLLAHSDLFRAGIARSGAYNRTLTPFGFQSEPRTLWQAQEMYLKVSPFMFAHKLKEPILLIHGEADNNTGTFPIQSERFYQALKGNAGNVRYVTLPHESHGYAARESIEHTLWEMMTWFDKHVKNAGGATASNR
jgi:dipeptidyl aminopeptidase/acylaminoacyl peptidase